MHRSTAGTPEAAEIDGLGPAGEIRKHKAVPPQPGLTTRAGCRLGPGKISAKASNILDVDGNRKYQWINSCKSCYSCREGVMDLVRGPSPHLLYYRVWGDSR